MRRSRVVRWLAKLYPLYVIMLLGACALAFGGIVSMVVLLMRGDFTQVVTAPVPQLGETCGRAAS